MHTSHNPQQKHLLVNRELCEYIQPEKLGVCSEVRKVCRSDISGVVAYLVYDSGALGACSEDFQSCNEYSGLGRWADEPFEIISSKDDAALYHEIISESNEYSYQDISEEVRNGMIDFMGLESNTTSITTGTSVGKKT